MNQGVPPLGREATPRRGAFDVLEGSALRLERYGRIAGLLYIVGALVSLNNLWLRSDPDTATILWLFALGAGTGVVCLLLAWRRLTFAWLHGVVVVATIEATLSVEYVGLVSAWYYAFIVVLVALAFSRRREVATHVVLVAAALAIPAIYAAEPREHLLQATVGVPTLAFVAAVITYLRERLEVGQHTLLELSRQDALTGVGNYRHMREAVREAIAGHGRRERSFALIVIDLDGFKRINDTEGHLYGDRVLREVGRVLREAVRTEDRVFRQGGDEFSVLAPETGEDEAAVLAERIEEAVRGVPAGDWTLTASMAWAIFPIAGVTEDALFDEADAELMASKRRQ